MVVELIGTQFSAWFRAIEDVEGEADETKTEDTLRKSPIDIIAIGRDVIVANEQVERIEHKHRGDARGTLPERGEEDDEEPRDKCGQQTMRNGCAEIPIRQRDATRTGVEVLQSGGGATLDQVRHADR
jgi:hypothetical protein